MADYIECVNLLDGISSSEFGLDEIIDELIYKHNLDFLHDNNEDAVREFAKDLIGSIKNYIKTEPTADIEEVKHGEWIRGGVWGDTGSVAYKCSVCKETTYDGDLFEYCPHCGAKMDGESNNRPHMPDDYSFEVGV